MQIFPKSSKPKSYTDTRIPILYIYIIRIHIHGKPRWVCIMKLTVLESHLLYGHWLTFDSRHGAGLHRVRHTLKRRGSNNSWTWIGRECRRLVFILNSFLSFFLFVFSSFSRCCVVKATFSRPADHHIHIYNYVYPRRSTYFHFKTFRLFFEVGLLIGLIWYPFEPVLKIFMIL